jgi:CoA:oxalate CoA-transferase
MERLLDHLKVLDLSRAVSGPFAGRVLSDLGADVVKVEPPSGDVSDAFGVVQAGRSGLFAQLNAGKRNVRLDLADPEDLAYARSLAAVADVVIENFRPGVIDRLGLGYESLIEDNPSVVMLSISGFGANSPEAERRAFAPVVHAESGLLLRQARFDDRPPSDYSFALADTLAALHGVVALLAALASRDRTGTGQHIDLSMLDALVASDDYTHEVLDGRPGLGNRGTIWDATGGPVVVAADVRSAWASLKASEGLDDGLPPTASLEEKISARRARIDEWLHSFESREALFEALDRVGIAFGDVRAPEDLLDEPSMRARPPYDDVDDGGGGTRRVVRMPYRFSAASAGIAGRVSPPDGDRISVSDDWLKRGGER